MRLRPATPADAGAVLAVLVARDVADVGEPDYTLADLQDEWSASEFELSRDSIVVQDADGRIIGYAVTRRPGTLAAVDPDHEGRGVGTLLLEWAERRAVEQDRSRHRQWLGSSNDRGKDLLGRAGYRYARSYWRMVRTLERTSAERLIVAGVSFRALDPGSDAPSLHALDDASFSANPDYQPVSLQAFTEEHLDAHNVDTGLSLVAERAGRPIGFLLTLRWQPPPAGYVDILAVHPDHQREGIGTALLLEAFAAYAEAGLLEAQLTVASDNPRALALYERAGMTAKFEFQAWERAIGAPA